MFVYDLVRTMFLELLILHEKASSRQYDHIYIGKKDSNMSCMTH